MKLQLCPVAADVTLIHPDFATDVSMASCVCRSLMFLHLAKMAEQIKVLLWVKILGGSRNM